MTHLQVEQQDLVDRYLMKKLPPVVEDAFVQHFLSCQECLVQLESSREVITALQHARGFRLAAVGFRPRRRFVSHLPAWGLVAALGMAAVYFNMNRLPRPVLPPPPPAEPRPAAVPAAAPVIELRSFRSGDDAVAKLTAPAAAGFLLRLDLRGIEAHPRYRVELATGRGQIVWSRDLAPTVGGEKVDAAVQGLRLSPGHYWVRLSTIAAEGPTRLLREFRLQIAP